MGNADILAIEEGIGTKLSSLVELESTGFEMTELEDLELLNMADHPMLEAAGLDEEVHSTDDLSKVCFWVPKEARREFVLRIKPIVAELHAEAN